MKQSETSAHEKQTIMFHQCFRSKNAKYLFLHTGNHYQKRMKQRCFTLCFIKIGYLIYLNSDFDSMKHFWREKLKTGFS
jgi:UDP-N-acetylglucosamine 2-epimerase